MCLMDAGCFQAFRAQKNDVSGFTHLFTEKIKETIDFR